MPMRYEEARTPTCGNKENADYDIIGNDGGHELVRERWINREFRLKFDSLSKPVCRHCFKTTTTNPYRRPTPP